MQRVGSGWGREGAGLEGEGRPKLILIYIRLHRSVKTFTSSSPASLQFVKATVRLERRSFPPFPLLPGSSSSSSSRQTLSLTVAQQLPGVRNLPPTKECGSECERNKESRGGAGWGGVGGPGCREQPVVWTAPQPTAVGPRWDLCGTLMCWIYYTLLST